MASPEPSTAGQTECGNSSTDNDALECSKLPKRIVPIIIKNPINGNIIKKIKVPCLVTHTEGNLMPSELVIDMAAAMTISKSLKEFSYSNKVIDGKITKYEKKYKALNSRKEKTSTILKKLKLVQEVRHMTESSPFDDSSCRFQNTTMAPEATMEESPEPLENLTDELDPYSFIETVEIAQDYDNEIEIETTPGVEVPNILPSQLESSCLPESSHFVNTSIYNESTYLPESMGLAELSNINDFFETTDVIADWSNHIKLPSPQGSSRLQTSVDFTKSLSRLELPNQTESPSSSISRDVTDSPSPSFSPISVRGGGSPGRSALSDFTELPRRPESSCLSSSSSPSVWSDFTESSSHLESLYQPGSPSVWILPDLIESPSRPESPKQPGSSSSPVSRDLTESSGHGLTYEYAKFVAEEQRALAQVRQEQHWPIVNEQWKSSGECLHVYVKPLWDHLITSYYNWPPHQIERVKNNELNASGVDVHDQIETRRRGLKKRVTFDLPDQSDSSNHSEPENLRESPGRQETAYAKFIELEQRLTKVLKTSKRRRKKHTTSNSQSFDNSQDLPESSDSPMKSNHLMRKYIKFLEEERRALAQIRLGKQRPLPKASLRARVVAKKRKPPTKTHDSTKTRKREQ